MEEGARDPPRARTSRELETLVKAAQALSQSFDIAVIGGVSLGAWTEPRNTNDVDILIRSTDFLASILKTQGDRLDRALVERECAAIGIDPPW